MPTTELSLIALNKIMTKTLTKSDVNNMSRTHHIRFLRFSSLSIPKKSIQNEVVSAVNAESVVAKVAWLNPIRKLWMELVPNG
jgi:hypothetical protein